MGLGLQNEATIRIHFVTDGTDAKELANILRNLGKAINAETIAKQFDALNDELRDTRSHLSRLVDQYAELRGEMDSIEETRKAEIAAAKEAGRAAAEAANKATTATKRTKKEEEDRRRAIEQLRRALTGEAAAQQTLANGLAALLAKRRADAAAAKVQATESARAEAAAAKEVEDKARAIKASQDEARALVAASKARQAHNEELEEERQRRAANLAIFNQMKARYDAEDEAIAAANAERRRAVQAMSVENAQRRMLAIAVAQGNDFQKRNAQLIGQITNVRRGDIKAIRDYITALRNAISVETQRQNMLRGISATGTQMGFVDTLKARMSDAEKAVDALFRASYRLQMVGNNLMNWSRNVFRLGSEIMTTFGDFEFMLNRARGALQIWEGATLGAVDGGTALTESVVDLSQELKILPAKEIAQGLFYWSAATGEVVKTQTDLNDQMNALEPIMKAAIMTNTSYEATIKGVYSILTQYYNGSLEKAAYVTEQLFYTTQTTAAEFDDLIQSFKMVGPVAAQMGVSFEEVNETLGRLADLGIRGTMAGRGLRQLFIQTAKPSGPAMKAINKVWSQLKPDVFGGQTFQEVMFPDGEFVGITKQMHNLAKAVEHLDTAERTRLLAAISTANMLPITTALVAQQSLAMNGLTEDVNKYTSSAEKANKFFRENWKLLDNSWNALRGSIDRAVDAIRISIGGIVSDALRPFIEWVQKLLDKFNEFIKANPELVAGISKITAALAAGSGLAGAIFVVLGALTGLGAAISFVGNSFSFWATRITQVVGALGFLFTAVLDNFNYLQNAASDIMDNLTGAFGAAEESIVMLGGTVVTVTKPAGELHSVLVDLADAFVKITAPARELAGIIVRVAADLAVRVSELVSIGANLPLVSEALQGLVVALGALVSARIIGGLLGLANAVKGFLAVAVVSKIMGVANAFVFLGKATKTLGAGAGIKGLGLAIGSLVGGPLGLVGLGLTAGFLAIEAIPELGNALNGLSQSFANVNENLAKTVEGMGELGQPLLEETLRFLKVDEVTRPLAAEKAKWDKALRDFDQLYTGKNLGSDPAARAEAAEQAKLILQSVGLPTEEFISEIQGSEVFSATKLGEVLRERQARAQADLDAVTGTANAQATIMLKDLESDYDTYAGEAAKVADGIVRSEQEWQQAFLNLSTRPGFDNISQDVMSGIVSDLFLKLPEFFTEEDVREAASSNRLLSKINIDALLAAVEHMTGDASTEINKEILNALNKGFSIQDPEGIQQFLDSPVGGGITASYFDLLFDAKYADIHDEIRLLIAEYEKKVQEGIGGLPLNQIEASLTETYNTLTRQALEDITPEFTALSQELMNFSMLGPDYYEDMARAITEATIPSGEKLLDAFLAGDLGLGQAGLKLVEIAKFLSAEGYGGPELERMVKEVGEQVGENTAETVQRGLRSGIAEGLGRDRLTVESVVDMRKLGSFGQQVGKVIQGLAGKAMDMAMGGNLQSRMAGREQARLDAGLLIDSLVNIEGKEPATQRRLQGKWSRSFRKALPSMPKMVRQIIRQQMTSAAEEGILPWETVQKFFPKIEIPAGELITVTKPEGEEGGGKSMWETLAPGLFGTGGGETGVEISSNVLGTPEALAGIGKQASTNIVSGVTSQLRSEDTSGQIATALKNLIQTGMNTALTPISNAVKLIGKVIVNSIAAGLKSGYQTIFEAMRLTVLGASMAIGFMSHLWGFNIGSSWGDGVAAGIRASVGDIKAAQDEIKPVTKDGSPPKEGPLRNFDKWGEGVGESWGEGVGKGMARSAHANMRKVRAALREGQDRSVGRAELKSENTKTVKVKVEVTSPDGSVDRVKAGQLRKGLMEAFALAGLEHMVTVG